MGVFSGAMLRERWFWLGAWAFWLVLALPRLSFASSAGVCDERGASVIVLAPPLPRPVTDESLKPTPPSEPAALCEQGQGRTCYCDEGRPLAPHVSDVTSVESLALPSLLAALRAPWVEMAWPATPRSSGPIGWPRPVEHPPRG